MLRRLAVPGLAIWLLLLLVPVDAFAAAYFSSSGGTWNGANRWRTGVGAGCGMAGNSGAAYPGSAATSDTATICNNTAVTLPITPANAISSLTIGSTCANNTSLASATTSVALTVNGNVNIACANSTLSFNGAGGVFTLTVNGNISNTGIVSVSANTRVHTLNISGDISSTGNFSLRNNAVRVATLNLTGAGMQTISGTTTNFDLKDVGATSATNDFTINKSAGSVRLFGDLDTAGTLTVTAGTFNIIGTDAAQTLTIGVSITNDGTVILGNSSRTHTMSVGSDITNNGTGSFDLRRDANDRVSLTFTGGGTHTIAGTTTGTTEFWDLTANNDLTVDKTAGATVTQTGNLDVNGNFTISAGTVTLSGSGGAQALTVDGNITNNGTFTLANVTVTHTLSVGGDFTNNGTFTFILDASTLMDTTFNGTVAQAIGGSSTTTFNNLTISNDNSPATAVSVNTNINVGNATSAAVTLNMNGANTVLTPAAAVVINTSSTQGTITGSGTINVTRTAATADYMNQYLFTTNTLSGLTVNYSGAGAQTVNASATVGTYGSLIASNSGTKTLGGAVTVNTNGTLAINTSGVVLDMSTFTADCSGGGTIAVVNGATLKIGGTNGFPAGYTTTSLTATSTVEYYGTDQSVAGVGYGNLTLSTSGTKTLAAAATVATTLSVNTSGVIFDLSTFTCNGGGSSTLSAVNGATLKIDGTNGFLTGYSTVTLGATSTVEYYGSTQTVGGQNYGHLTLSGSATKTLGATASVKGDLTVNTSGVTFDLSSNTCNASGGVATITIGNGATLKIGGTNTFPSGYATTTLGASSTVEHNGSAQNVGALGYANLTISGSGTKTLAGNASVSATLTLSNGLVSTGANQLSIGAAASVSRCASLTECFVVGNLVRGVAIGSPTLTWDIGVSAPAAAYTPVTLALTTVTVAGTVLVTTTNGDHANIGTSQLDASLSVNRYWTVTNTGVTYVSVDATFGFAAADVDGGASTANLAVGKYRSSDWSYPDVGTTGATSTQATTILFADGFGDFQVAEVSTTATPLTLWHMDQQSWNGTANEVQDSGSGGYHGQAAGLSATKPTTSMTTPAIAGNPGTCQYGVFNRANKDYVAVPTGFPNLGVATSFTVAVWIRTTDNTQSGQRVFADDENGTQGYALSLGDPGAGRLRFFARGTSTISLDDTNVLVNNRWYFVVISADTTLKRKRIYVYDSVAAIWLPSSTHTWTTTFGTGDAGAASIGGETNSAVGEATSAFGFAGNIDEVRVYQVALGKAHLDRIRQLTQPCVTFDHFAISHDGSAVNCQVEPVTIAAHISDHSLLTTYVNTVNLTTGTGHGDWVSVGGDSGTLNNGTVDDGAATYTFALADGGDAVLGLKDTFAETVNIDAADGAITETSGSAIASEDQDLVFSETGFNFLADGVASAVGTQISGKDSNVAPGSQSLEIQAIRTSDTTGACAAALNAATTIQMKLACIDPASCSNPVSITGTSTVSVPTSYTSVNLNFSSGVAPFSLSYPDAGQIRLDAQYDIPLSGGGASGNLMQGSSNTFVVKPAGLCVESTDPNSDCPSGDDTCTVFKAAGATFNLTVKGVAWQSAGEANTDFCSGNTVTPNFQMNSIALTSTLVAPAGGSNATLGATSVNVTTGGTVTAANETVSEVGVFQITATPPAYFGQTIAASTSANIGRFVPDRFNVSVNTPTFAHACSAGGDPLTHFTYMDQPFRYETAPVLTVTALNESGATTLNYGSTFWKLKVPPLASPLLSGRIFTDQSGHAAQWDLPVLGSDHAALGGETDLDGQGTLTLTAGDVSGADMFKYMRTAVPEAPFNADVDMLVPAVDLSDDDNVCYDSDNNGSCDTFTIVGITGTGAGTKQQRYGRLVIGTAAGSELLALNVPMQVEYFDGAASAFVVNADDICTSIDATSDLTLSSNVEAGETDGTVDVSDSGTCADGTTTATIANNPVLNGLAGLTLSGPGSTCTGQVEVGIDLSTGTGIGLDWLQYNWVGGGGPDENPAGEAAFGVFSGKDELIYRREPWN